MLDYDEPPKIWLPKLGYIAPQDSNEEVEELFDLQAVLEGYTLRLICETISEETLKQLNGYIEKGEDALKKNR